MNRSEFDQALRQLLREGVPPTPGFRNERCTDIPGCLFCSDCQDCYRCTYCRDCVQCTQCTHCVGCRAVHASSYCRDCERCTDSQYLVACTGCVGCTYCYGCVGLKNAEFHILNVAYDRKTYFAIVAELDDSAR